MRKFITTSNLAMVLCLVGVTLLFMPWAGAVIWTLDPIPQADGSYTVKSWPPAVESYPGYRFRHGTASAITFLSQFLSFLATAQMRPAPRWRPVAVLAVGGTVLAVVIIGLNTEPSVFRSDMSVGRAVQPRWGASNFVALGLAASLMALAALELRPAAMRATRDSTSPEGVSAGEDMAGLTET
jgi:hypothetical protein